MTLLLLQLGLLAGLAQSPAAEQASAKVELDRMVPADAMIAWFGRPEPEQQSANSTDKLAAFLMLLKNVGMMPQQGQVITDIFAGWTMLGHRRHALALLDITARKLDADSYRLNDMHAVLLMDSEGIARELDRRVRDLLGTYGDAKHDRIEKLAAAGHTYYQLSDMRLPQWSTVEWGTIGTVFVAGFGRGSFAAVADTAAGRRTALASDGWYANAHAACEGTSSRLELYAALGQISANLDKVLDGRAAAVLAALEMQNSQKLLWTVGFQDRQMRSAAIYQDEHRNDHYLKLTGNETSDPAILAVVPPAASAYAPFRISLPDTVYLARDGFLQSQSFDSRQGYYEMLAYLQQDYGCDVTGGLVEQLGEHLIFHTYPPHPMGLPLLCTIWIEIEDRNRVADTISKLMAGWQKENARMAGEESNLLSPAVKCTKDGIWYLQMGLLGPAIGVADGWIVISFSPIAVRKNLQYLAKNWRSADHPHPPYARGYEPRISATFPAPAPDSVIAEAPEPPATSPNLPTTPPATQAARTVQPSIAATPDEPESTTPQTPAVESDVDKSAADDPKGLRLHTVQPRETMAALAQRYYGDRGQVWRILQANPDKDPMRLAVGTVLKIPPGKPKSKSNQK